MEGIKVELVDYMGNDSSVSNSARVSFNKWKDTFDDNDTKLIKYLASHKHMTPFRHTQVQLRCKAPIFLARQLGKHQAGLCLHEDTEVTIIRHHKGASNNKKTAKIKDIYKMWTGQVKYQGGKKGIMNVQKHRVRVYNEETKRFETSKILNVIDSGIKSVYEVTDIYGNKIKASLDHDFLTTVGWKKLKDLEVGDYLIRDDVGESFGYTGELPRGLDKATRNKFRSLGGVCANCGSSEKLEADHVKPVVDHPDLANDMSNLQLLCEDCHKKKSRNEKKAKTTLLPKAVPIIDISFAGEAQTYDLTVENIHNFMGNGFVVHNSWNEVSRRYVDTQPEFFFPNQWRNRPEGGIKQGSGSVVSEDTLFETDYYHEYSEYDKQDIYNTYSYIIDESLRMYNQFINKGVAPEMARMVLPQSMLTEWVWSGNLLAFAHVYKERSSSGAQVEAQEFAKELDKVIRPLFPVAWSALVDGE